MYHIVGMKKVCNGRLYELLRIAGPLPKRGECRLFFNIEQSFSTIAVCGLGDKCLAYNEEEMIDEGKEVCWIVYGSISDDEQ